MKKKTAKSQPKSRRKKLAKLPETLPELTDVFMRERGLKRTPAVRLQAICQRLEAFGRQNGDLCKGLFNQLRQGQLIDIHMLLLVRDSVLANDEAATVVMNGAYDDSDIVRHCCVCAAGIVLDLDPERATKIGAFPVLYSGLTAKSEDTRAIAVVSLGRYALEQPRVELGDIVLRLLPVLNDSDHEVRQQTAHALGMCGRAAEAALPRLRDLTDDPCPDVRQAVSVAMAAINKEVAGRTGPTIETGMRVKTTHALTFPGGLIALPQGAEGVVVGRSGRPKHAEWGWQLIIRFAGHPVTHLFYEDELEVVQEEGTGSPGAAAASA